jgi:hypothetical protein
MEAIDLSIRCLVRLGRSVYGGGRFRPSPFFATYEDISGTSLMRQTCMTIRVNLKFPYFSVAASGLAIAVSKTEIYRARIAANLVSNVITITNRAISFGIEDKRITLEDRNQGRHIVPVVAVKSQKGQ